MWSLNSPVVRFLKKSQGAIERPLSYLSFREIGISSSERLSHLDRTCLKDFLPALREQRPLVIYDIGANRGTHSLALAKLLPVHRIIAFEPLPDIYQQLLSATKSYPNISSANIALGETNGFMDFYLNDFHPSSSALPMLSEHVKHFPRTQNTTLLNVPVQRLDDYVASENAPLPDLIKLDVQGFEDRILTGGRQTFSNARWVHAELTVAPLYAEGVLFDEMYRCLASLDFQLHAITGQLSSSNGVQLQINALFERKCTFAESTNQVPTSR